MIDGKNSKTVSGEWMKSVHVLLELKESSDFLEGISQSLAYSLLALQPPGSTYLIFILKITSTSSSNQWAQPVEWSWVIGLLTSTLNNSEVN